MRARNQSRLCSCLCLQFLYLFLWLTVTCRDFFFFLCVSVFQKYTFLLVQRIDINLFCFLSYIPSFCSLCAASNWTAKFFFSITQPHVSWHFGNCVLCRTFLVYGDYSLLVPDVCFQCNCPIVCWFIVKYLAPGTRMQIYNDGEKLKNWCRQFGKLTNPKCAIYSEWARKLHILKKSLKLPEQ